MDQFVDRRLNGRNKSAVNRERFIRRFKAQIKKALAGVIAKRSITDFGNGERVVIPAKDTHEPTFHHGRGGKRDTIYPGNREFIKGDKVKRPPNGEGQGAGSGASNEGSGEDSFVFDLSREEFLDLFFDDLELPDIVRKEISEVPLFKSVHAGYAITGTPANINVLRSLRGAKSRRFALGGPLRKKLDALEKKLEQALAENAAELEVHALRDEITHVKKRLAAIPFLDSVDLRYNLRELRPEASTQAVMFCIMDVSGSMDEAKKDIAKRFFILLHLFLTKKYERIELVFIRHHTTAKEVDEQEFFYSRETGGTVVSSALELMRDVMNKRYPSSQWNIYIAQASDGDNWNADSPYCAEVLLRDILPYAQYYAYVEIMARHHQSLWEMYSTVKAARRNFAMQAISQPNEIYSVLRELFGKEAHESR